MACVRRGRAPFLPATWPACPLTLTPTPPARRPSGRPGNHAVATGAPRRRRGWPCHGAAGRGPLRVPGVPWAARRASPPLIKTFIAGHTATGATNVLVNLIGASRAAFAGRPDGPDRSRTERVGL